MFCWCLFFPKLAYCFPILRDSNCWSNTSLEQALASVNTELLHRMKHSSCLFRPPFMLLLQVIYALFLNRATLLSTMLDGSVVERDKEDTLHHQLQDLPAQHYGCWDFGLQAQIPDTSGTTDLKECQVITVFHPEFFTLLSSSILSSLKKCILAFYLIWMTSILNSVLFWAVSSITTPFLLIPYVMVCIISCFTFFPWENIIHLSYPRIFWLSCYS